MPVKLHGVIRAQHSPGGATVTPIRPSVPVAPPPTPAPKKPEAFKAPWTVGRVLYFIVLACGLSLGGSWVVGWLRFVSAVGVIERDVDRLAPRERGRITRVDVKNGDTVKAGQPLVWLDYDHASGAFISDAAARANAHNSEIETMRERRQEIDRLSAQARTQMAGWQATARGLAPQRRTLGSTQLSALRLKREGAATEAEVSAVQVQLQQVEQQLATAREQARAQERVLVQLRAEADALDQTLAQKEPAPTADEGVIAASRDGVVAWVAFHAGEVVGPDSQVLLITDDQHVRVRAFVQPKDATSLEPGKPAEVHLPSGEVLPGKVNRVGLLASVAPEPIAPSLGKPQQPTLTAQPLPPVDPNAAFLLAEIAVDAVPPAIGARLAAGAPCEVRVKRSWAWLRELVKPIERVWK
jgi:membrane fusion protein (multidrug efflux system)